MWPAASAPTWPAMLHPTRRAHHPTLPAVAEALLGYFVAAPPVPLRTKVFQYVPYDARSALRIVRSAAGEREPAVPGAARACAPA